MFQHHHHGSYRRGGGDPFVDLLIAVPIALIIAGCIIWLVQWLAK